MRLVTISDQHGNLPNTPPCDCLIICGDFCPIYNHDPIFQAHWLDTAYRRWLETRKAHHIVSICGNHDIVYEHTQHLVPKLPWTYLENSSVQIENLKIWGSPFTPRFGEGWAFNADPPQLEQLWSQIPNDTDILITHGPPLGYGDAAPRGRKVEHVGSPSLLERIKIVKPKLVAFGHIHNGRGVWDLDGTILANTTLVNEQYKMVYPPMEFEL